MQPLDMEVGAGTFHPATFLQSLRSAPWFACYAQPCRRPTDGRYGENPNRLQHYFQFQVIQKPSTMSIQEDFLQSLQAIGIDTSREDIRFVEDNWESPTQGAWGLGWEVWLNGMEVAQFTFFQQVGGHPCHEIVAEITYGLERMCMHLQQVDSVYDLIWSHHGVTYGDIWQRNEQQMSKYHFELASCETLLSQFEQFEQQFKVVVEQGLVIPAYEMVIKCSHLFNILDARGAISVTQRQQFLLRVRTLAMQVADTIREQEAA